MPRGTTRAALHETQPTYCNNLGPLVWRSTRRFRAFSSHVVAFGELRRVGNVLLVGVRAQRRCVERDNGHYRGALGFVEHGGLVLDSGAAKQLGGEFVGWNRLQRAVSGHFPRAANNRRWSSDGRLYQHCFRR